MSLMQPLSKLKKGQSATISGFVDENVPTKFYEMGFIPGTKLEIRHKAPFNGPICVCLSKNNCMLALRQDEASCILTEIK